VGTSDTGFSKANRTRLVYLLKDLLDFPHGNRMGEVVGGEELYKLDELLRFQFGRFELQPGARGSIVDKIGQFIMAAPEEELLTFIAFIPVAKAKARRYLTSPGVRLDVERRIEKIQTTINGFLKFIGCPARFENGTFVRDSFEIVDATPLTLLPKKEELEQDLQGILSGGELVSLVLIDLDNFKAVNDRHDYATGDQCLEAVVQTASDAIARKGKLYRFREGDEFAVVLRNTTTAEAAATASRIRQAIEQRNPGGDVKVTASMGVASSECDDIDTANDLTRAAVEALHTSKRTTKNCVTAWRVQPDSA
jgi:diguanylate cyclase (GGDEF)-like protein